ncbi:MAG TPA: FHA domain-containing protein, partial [Polyangiaceae bacterium]|nr:FHA domain-containing protein [Polyangiaceae bacterium]
MAPRIDAMAPMQPNKPSFTIVISEKGGAERRETFSTFELGIGRVQGNDLTLVKGNVSKQHARIAYRDGVFVVADLNSTNGTYVNRRKIQEPTKIGEGDRVYVGDFILRIESVEHPAPVVGQPAGEGDTRFDSKSVPDSTTTKGKVPPEVQQVRLGYPEVPAAPKIPSPGTTSWADNSSGRISVSNEDLQIAARAAVSDPVVPGTPAATISPGERDANTLLTMLVEAVVEVFGERWVGGATDHEQHLAVDRAIDEQLQRLAQTGNFAPSIQLDRIRVLARAEILGLGPLGRLIEDASISEILVPRFDQLLVRRNGNLEPSEPCFSSRRALRRVILRLCTKSGRPATSDEMLVERALPNGAMLWAVFPPLAMGQPSLILRKPRESTSSLQGLVRAGVISRAMSVFLQQAVMARSRILVIGPRDADIGTVSGALLSTIAEGSTALIEGAVDLGIATLPVPSFRWSLLAASDLPKLVSAAARASAQVFGVSIDDGRTTAAVVDVLGATGVGVVAVREARTSEYALSQMTAELMAHHPGITVDAARRLLAGAFDLLLEVVRYRDGRQRLIRLGEIGRVTADEIEVEDVFTFVASSDMTGELVEGTFRSTGSIPHVVEELMARGAQFDTNVFAR